MSIFKIDEEKCDNDGICAMECPTHIIKMTKQGPVPVEGAQEFCIQCGHCVAVCPKGAISLEFLSPDQCMPIEKDLLLNADQTGLPGMPPSWYLPMHLMSLAVVGLTAIRHWHIWNLPYRGLILEAAGQDMSTMV